MRFHATVEVSGLEGIADPEGQTIERALPALGFEGIEHLRVGKVVRLDLEAADEESARGVVEDLCRRLLANPVIERYEIGLSHQVGAK
ncbi:MAG: phosphoribosylformylglycinamidine synthase subunit PurS [Acidimicrobiales bacterium]